VAENRLIGTIKIISSSFNDAALLYDMLADVSMPRSQNGAPWRPWYDGGRHGSLCLIYLREFCA
jgi:hypothetical protein